MITNNGNINSALEAWRDIKIEQSPTESNVHLEKKTLIRLAADGGLEEVSPNELEHLDNCPLCLSTWSAWRRAFAVANENEDNENENELTELNHDEAYGFLEAAATTSAKTQALVVESSCGTYRLEILPNREEPNEGMIVLSRLTKDGDQQLTVRDKKGHEILSGTLENGRLARLYRNLNELDLSVWTVNKK